jgi:hypothetical protein
MSANSYIKCVITGTDDDAQVTRKSCVFSAALTDEGWHDTLCNVFKFSANSEICYSTPDGDVFPGLTQALRSHIGYPAPLKDLGICDETGIVRFSIQHH